MAHACQGLLSPLSLKGSRPPTPSCYYQNTDPKYSLKKSTSIIATHELAVPSFGSHKDERNRQFSLTTPAAPYITSNSLSFIPTLPRKTAIITGVSPNSIGYAIAHILKEINFDLILITRNEVSANTIREKFSNHRYTNISVHTCDLSSIQQTIRTTKKIASIHQEGIDALIHAAAVLKFQPSITTEGHDEVTVVNSIAPFILSTLLSDNLKKNQGRIVNISSNGHKQVSKRQLDHFIEEYISTEKEETQTTWLSSLKKWVDNLPLIKVRRGFDHYFASKLIALILINGFHRQNQECQKNQIELLHVHPGMVSSNLAKNIPPLLPPQLLNKFGISASDLGLKIHTFFTRAISPTQSAQYIIPLIANKTIQNNGSDPIQYIDLFDRQPISDLALSNDYFNTIYQKCLKTYKLHELMQSADLANQS